MPSALAPYLCSFLLVSIASLRRELRQANKTIRSHEAAYRRGYARIPDHEFDQMAAAREKLKAQLRVVAAHAPELEEPPPLYVFVDELHWFITRGYERMLVECAKHRIAWIMAIHGFAQVSKQLVSMMLGTCLAKVFLGGDYDDAIKIMKQLRVNDVTLKKYEALIGLSDGYKVWNPVKCYPPPELPEIPKPNFLADDEEAWI